MSLAVSGAVLMVMLVGYTGVKSFAEEIRTDSVLKDSKNCVLARVLENWTYPEFTKERNCTETVFYSVDSCLCEVTDGWGQPLRFIGGVNASLDSIAGQLIADIPSSNATGDFPDSSSKIIDTDSRNVTNVAYILVSFGADGLADHTSYGKLFSDGNASGVLDVTDVPDFSNLTDDRFVYVTGQMLRGQAID